MAGDEVRKNVDRVSEGSKVDSTLAKVANDNQANKVERVSTTDAAKTVTDAGLPAGDKVMASKSTQDAALNIAELVRNPESLEKVQDQNQRDVEKAIASKDPEKIKPVLQNNEKQVAAVQNFVKDTGAKLDRVSEKV